MRRIFALSLLFMASPAHAHTLPAALGIAGIDAAGPWAVRIAHGMAVQDTGDRWRFVCPIRWGGPDTALAKAATRDALWVVGAEGPRWLDRLGIAHGVDAPGLSSTTVRRLIAGPDAVYALAVIDGQTSIWRLADGAARVIAAPRGIAQSIATDGVRIWTARTDPAGIAIESFSADGTAGAEWIARADLSGLSGASLSLEALGGALWAKLDGRDVRAIYRVDAEAAEERIRTTNALLGPALLEDHPVAAVASELTSLEGRPVRALSPLTCLEPEAFGCARTAIIALADQPAQDQEAFSMSAVLAPALDGLSTGDALACKLEWLDFATEAGLDPALDVPPLPAPIEMSENSSAKGCSATGFSPLSAIVPALAWAFSRARSRARPGRR
ncbi:MAG: hypothetical protein U1E65_08910 [Myxococcota bacterium]